MKGCAGGACMPRGLQEVNQQGKMAQVALVEMGKGQVHSIFLLQSPVWWTSAGPSQLPQEVSKRVHPCMWPSLGSFLCNLKKLHCGLHCSFYSCCSCSLTYTVVFISLFLMPLLSQFPVSGSDTSLFISHLFSVLSI